MSETLFEMPVCESPRLKWLREHGVITKNNFNFKPTHSDDFRYGYSWCAYVGNGEEVEIIRAEGCIGYGNTEQDAIVSLAIKRGWKLWNEDDFHAQPKIHLAENEVETTKAKKL